MKIGRVPEPIGEILASICVLRAAFSALTGGSSSRPGWSTRGSSGIHLADSAMLCAPFRLRRSKVEEAWLIV